jgi:uncharacterized membrane protein
MTDIDGRSGLPESAPLGITHLIYALHAWSALVGITTSVFVVTAFLIGWPSIIAVVLNYVKRGATEGTYLESHFTWQIRTFWFALLWVCLAVIPAITIIGLPLAWGMWIGTGLWVIYRIARGWVALVDRRPMPLP